MKRSNILRFSMMALIAIVTCSSAGAQVKANDEPLSISITQPVKENLRFTVIVANPGHEKVRLKLISKAYGTIERKVFSKGQYGMICNLSDAEDGEYTIEVSTRNQVIKKAIFLNTVNVLETNRMVSFSAPVHNRQH